MRGVVRVRSRSSSCRVQPSSRVTRQGALRRVATTRRISRAASSAS